MQRTFRLHFAAGVLAVVVVLLFGYLIGTSGTIMAAPAKNLPQVPKGQVPETAVGSATAAARTIYMTRGKEGPGAAEHMNRLHAAMADKGYVFVAMSPHHENNDLKGWWVTYVPTGHR